MDLASRTWFGGRDGFGFAVLDGFVVGVAGLEGLVVGVAAGGVEVGVLAVVGTVGIVSATGFMSLPQATSKPIVATPAVPASRAFFHPRVNMSPNLLLK
jgi:hypothetical protein